MKNILFKLMVAVVTVILTNTAIAQGVQSGAKIEFNKEVHDYGNIKYGGNGNSTFSFTNTGNAPLIIANSKSSCVCAVAAWSKEPLAPGATASITIKYDTKLAGPINKNVTITSNAVNEPTKVLRIKGNVAAPAEGSPNINGAAPTH